MASHLQAQVHRAAGCAGASMWDLPSCGGSQAGGFFALTIGLPEMKRQSPHSHKALGCFPHLSRVYFVIQANPWYPSGLLALGTEAGLKFTIMEPGGQFAMMTGTIQMPPSSAACWVSLRELPFSTWELVSESILNQEPLSLRC